MTLIKATDFIWCFESLEVKDMDIGLKASLLTIEIHCICSHIGYTFREAGDVLQKSFI